MSSYENYTDTAQNYDGTRAPVGIEIITGCLNESRLPLAHQTLLDAGCGTGNYSQALLKHVGHIVAVDMNSAMLDQARQKFDADDTKQHIEFHLSTIDALPVDGRSVDGIMVNQVLHHLNDDKDLNYPKISRVIQECARVLKPGGALLINTCSPEQIRRGFWYYSLIPEQMKSMCARHVPLRDLQQVMEENNFENCSRFTPVDGLLQGSNYFNASGPLDKRWRDGDSMWATVPEQTLAQVIDTVSALQQSGKLEQYLRKHDTDREHIGQTTFMYARRKS